ncbi:MAG: hypothetical protein JWM46_589 [Candidatus Kaiserbacteria bacterium]|nr:hypothetical protein [Candidatus Kaiserbacteria bacterium]
MSSIRIVLDAAQQDDTAPVFLEALKFTLRTAMPHEAFTLATIGNVKTNEISAQLRASSLCAIAECVMHGADECLHITPLEILRAANAAEIVLLMLVAATRERVLDMTILTYSAAPIPSDLSKGLDIKVRNARQLLIKERDDAERTPHIKALFTSVHSGYRLMAEMMVSKSKPKKPPNNLN